MPDFIVHIRLRQCCRSKLADIDKARSHLESKAPALKTILGELPVDQAIEKAPTVLSATAPAPGPTTARVNKACIKICRSHAQHHDDEGARTEAGFWKMLGALFRGDDIQSLLNELNPPAEQPDAPAPRDAPNPPATQQPTSDDPDGDGVPGTTAPPQLIPPNVA